MNRVGFVTALFRREFSLLLFLTLLPVCGWADDCFTWLKAKENPKGVVVLAHGLNLDPERMNFIGTDLQRDGYSVLRIAFKGHCGYSAQEEYLKVDYRDWLKEGKSFYQMAEQEAQVHKAPLHLVAYSLGALVYQALDSECKFAKKVLFAPALALRFWFPLVFQVADLWPDFQYPHLTNNNRKKNEKVSLRAVQGVKKLLDIVGGIKTAQASLVFLDPSDELVSFNDTKNLASRLPDWKFKEIKVTNSSIPHHLIVEKDAYSPENWKDIIVSTENFLEGKH